MTVQVWTCDRCGRVYESPVVVAGVDHHCGGVNSRKVLPLRLVTEQNTLPAEYLTGWVAPAEISAQGALFQGSVLA